jgi:Cu-Zn family superoxide dismutase
VPDVAIAVLHPTKGNDKVQGWVKFTQTKGGVEITAEVKGLTPGKHGFHIHEFGDLTSADGSSAGGHFNPTGEEHGAPDDDHRHVGDLGNIEAKSNGTATYSYTDDHLDLHTIFGRAVVVHAGEDDLKSQPSGDAGARVAVGVIGVAQKPAKPAAKSAGKTGAGAATGDADSRRTTKRIPLPDVDIDARKSDAKAAEPDTELK